MAGDLLIGIDVGTTSVKAALIDARGQALRSYGDSYPTLRPKAGEAEQDPREWMDRVLAALAHLTDGIETGRVAAAGLCSQVNTHVFVDAKGQPLRPAILWQDGRCTAEARLLDREISEARRLSWWGAPLPIDASHVLSRMAWVKRREPEIWQRTRHVLAPKDYCILALTGEAVADPMTSFGVVDSKLAYIAPLLGTVGGAAERQAPLRGFTETVGRIRGGLPGAGIPLVATTMDAWAGLLGSGITKDGDAGYLSGTSEVAAIVSPDKVPTPGVIAFPECEGIVLHAGPTQSGGASVAWLARVLGRTTDEISALAAQSDLRRPAPIFLPHLEGERAPLWDIAARGSFSGLDSSAGAPELCRAVLEGVAYSVRLLFDSLARSASRVPKSIRHSGGGARSDVWCQIRADVLGRPLERVASRDAGVVGAAMLAAIGGGLYRDIPEAGAALVRTERVFTPDPARRQMHDDGFSRYLDLYRRLKGFA